MDVFAWTQLASTLALPKPRPLTEETEGYLRRWQNRPDGLRVDALTRRVSIDPWGNG